MLIKSYLQPCWLHQLRNVSLALDIIYTNRLRVFAISQQLSVDYVQCTDGKLSEAATCT